MKILFLSSLYLPHTKGGGELSTHYIAQGLKARGHDIQVITQGEKREQTIINGVPVLRLPIPLTAKPLFERHTTQKIAKILEKEIGGYDIVHAHDFRTTMVLAQLNLPYSFATARDYAHICGSPNNLLADGTTCPGCNWRVVWQNAGVVEAPTWRQPFRAWQYAYNINYRRATWAKIPNHVYISRAQQAEFTKQGLNTTSPEHVIYNPVPPAYLTEPTKPGTAGNVLFVGTLQPYKGIDLLIQAWKKITKLAPHAHLKIVGQGAGRQEYEHQVERAGLQYQVTFTGYIAPDRMLRVYDEASVVVSPHRWVEPFGRTVAEAMARGKIVAAANIGGPAEIITDNQTGLLFNPNSSEALTGRLLEALQLPKARRQLISAAAQKWVSHNLTPDLIVRQHEELYQAPARG